MKDNECSGIDLFEELKSVIKTLDENKIPYALAGGLAYSILVETRTTEDIDLLVYPGDWERIPQILKPLGYMELSDVMDFKVIRIRRLTKIIGEDVLVLDFILVEGKIKEGIERALSIEYMNRTFKIVPPDILIEMKKSRMSSKDKSDIEGLEKLLEEDT